MIANPASTAQRNDVLQEGIEIAHFLIVGSLIPGDFGFVVHRPSKDLASSSESAPAATATIGPVRLT